MIPDATRSASQRMKSGEPSARGHPWAPVAVLLTISLAGPCLGTAIAHVPARGPALQDPAKPAVERLGWFAGCWEGELGGGTMYEEVWMAPRAGTLVGMARTTSGTATVGWEALRVEEDSGRLAYIAVPSGQRLTRFIATEISATSVTFENPEHDFPQRILYSRPSPDQLLARIEGVRDGTARAIDFPMRRVACPA